MAEKNGPVTDSEFSELGLLAAEFAAVDRDHATPEQANQAHANFMRLRNELTERGAAYGPIDFARRIEQANETALPSPRFASLEPDSARAPNSGRRAGQSPFPINIGLPSNTTDSDPSGAARAAAGSFAPAAGFAGVEAKGSAGSFSSEASQAPATEQPFSNIDEVVAEFKSRHGYPPGPAVDDGLAQLLSSTGLRPTAAALDLIHAAAQLATFKASEQDVISFNDLLFAAVELDRLRPSSTGVDAEYHAIHLIRVTFVGAQLERLASFNKIISGNFYDAGRSRAGWRSAALPGHISFSDNLLKSLASLPRGGHLTAIDLLRAALTVPGSYLQPGLDRLGIKADQLRAQLDLSARDVVSFNVDYHRDHSGPTPQEAERYAMVLARLFRVAKGEFSLALLAPWGRGKTTVARAVGEYLSQPDHYKTAFWAAFKVEPPAAPPLDRYDTVMFSAWAYRKQPELWIWLYESFVKSFLSRGLVINALRIFRAGVAKHGLLPLVRTLTIMAFLALPLSWLIVGIKGGLLIFGAATLIGLLLLARRWSSYVRSLIDRYGVIASHRERLGLQALIGDDLRALVSAWVGDVPRTAHACAFVIWIVGVAVAWATLAAGWIPTDGIAGLIDVHAAICEWQMKWCQQNATTTAAATWVAWWFWVALGGLFSAGLWIPLGRVNRVLLVVDDLDRCSSNEIVDLIDGVKLMLEDEKVGKRVQALILADPRVLNRAIASRFSDLINNDGKPDPAALTRVVREHMEKVFLCHFRMPPVAGQDIAKLAAEVAAELQSDVPSAQAFGPSASPRGDVSQAPQPGTAQRPTGPDLGPAETSSAEPPPRASTPTPSRLDETLTLSADETSAISDTIMRHFGGANGDDAPTPRFVRAFFFKYQLARMLLQIGGQPYKIAELSEVLAFLLEGKAGPLQAQPELVRVVEQVA